MAKNIWAGQCFECEVLIYCVYHVKCYDMLGDVGMLQLMFAREISFAIKQDYALDLNSNSNSIIET